MGISIGELNFDDAVYYHYDEFPPAKLDYAKLVVLLGKARDAIVRFDQILKTMHNSEFLIAPLRNQEAVISSRMEGTVSTMDEILQYEADYKEGVNESNSNFTSDVIETFLYQLTLKHAQQSIENNGEISDWLIRSLHQQLLLFGRGASKSPGAYKTEQNYLVDKIKRKVLFVPVSTEKLQEGLESLFSYIKDADEDILLKTAISHVEFEALHPFKDGNGRIGRMLITLMLWKAGVLSAPHFHISGYFEEHKDLYIDTMKNVSKNGDWTSWCQFFLEAVEQQAIRNLVVVENINNLYEEMKTIFREKLSSKYHDIALDFVFTNPKFRNNKFTSNAGIPSSTAYSFIKILLEEEIIKTVEEAAGNRPALYSFEPLMKIVRV